jgi:hypothetical protein
MERMPTAAARRDDAQQQGPQASIPLPGTDIAPHGEPMRTRAMLRLAVVSRSQWA